MATSTAVKHFMDIRGHDFYRAAAICPVVTLADPWKNAATYLKWIEKAYKEGVQLAIFPELGLNGYTIQDMLRQRVMERETNKAIKLLCSETEHLQMAFVVGAIVVIDDMLFNGAYVISGGLVRGIIIKTHNPNYGEFTEGRQTRNSSQLPRNVIYKPYQEEPIPVGDDLIFVDSDNPMVTFSGAICESDWAPVPRSTLNALKGARILFNISASNYQVGKAEWREHLLRRSGDSQTAMVYANAGPGESSTGLIFDGHRLIADRGKILIQSPLFEPHGGITIADIDLQGIVADRQANNTWAESVHMFKDLFPVREVTIPSTFAHMDLLDEENPYLRFRRVFDSEPFVPKSPEELDEVTMARIMAWRTRLEYLPENLRKIVIGVSGGKDSTSVLMLAVRLVELFGEELKMTNKDIVCLTMPGFGTTPETFDYATALGREWEVTFIEQDITALATLIFEMIGRPNLKEEVKDNKQLKTLFGNVQAWARKFLELSKAAEIGGIVVNTSSASELLIGWTTLFGDSAGHYAPNTGLGKSVIPRELIRLSETIYADQLEKKKLLMSIAYSVSSPELLLLDAQNPQVEDSEEENGPDFIRDFFAYEMFRYGRSPSTVLRLAIEAYDGVYTPQQLYGWLFRFITRFFQNRYKSNILSADTVKIGAVAPGAHDFLKVPSDINPLIWLQNLQELVPNELK
jgi:NAD+ synthase (glutamine-hydrolysing)